MLTQGKMAIYGQFLPRDVSAGRAPFREPPPTLPGKGPLVYVNFQPNKEGGDVLGLGMSQDTAKPRTSASWLGGARLARGGNTNAWFTRLPCGAGRGGGGNDTLSKARGCGFSAFAFVSFPVRLVSCR